MKHHGFVCRDDRKQGLLDEQVELACTLLSEQFEAALVREHAHAIEQGPIQLPTDVDRLRFQPLLNKGSGVLALIRYG